VEFRSINEFGPFCVWSRSIATKTPILLIKLKIPQWYINRSWGIIITLQFCSLILPNIWSTRISCNKCTGALSIIILIVSKANKLEQNKYHILLNAVCMFRTLILPGVAGKVREGFPHWRMSYVWMIESSDASPYRQKYGWWLTDSTRGRVSLIRSTLI